MASRYSGDGEVMETIYGKRSVFEVIKKSGLIKTEFYIYKDGSYHRGSYNDLGKAVQVAKDEG